MCVVWTGYDDSLPLGASEQGATAALPAFMDAMKAAHRGQKLSPWKEPNGTVHRKLDPRNGLLARDDTEGAFDEVFLTGTEPTETTPTPDGGGGGGGGGGASGSDAGSAGGAEPALPVETPAPNATDP